MRLSDKVMAKRLFLDVETCPPPELERERLNLELISKLDSRWRLANNIPDKECPEEQYKRLSLYPELGCLIAVSLILEEDGQIIHRGVLGRDRGTLLFHGDERRTLSCLWRLLAKVGLDERRDLIVGHNIEFDLLWLKKRSVIHGLRPPFNIYIPRYRSASFIFDTMKEWDLYTWRPGMKLQELAEILQVGMGKTGEACQVYEWYMEASVEAHQKLADYALQDVEVTKAVFKKLTFEGQ
jgi:hypothetical protein